MTDLAELNAKDPLSLTREDVREVVLQNRQFWKNYLEAGMKGSKAKVIKTKVDLASLEIDDD